jgi:hypothetical protein
MVGQAHEVVLVHQQLLMVVELVRLVSHPLLVVHWVGPSPPLLVVH